MLQSQKKNTQSQSHVSEPIKLLHLPAADGSSPRVPRGAPGAAARSQGETRFFVSELSVPFSRTLVQLL